MATEAAKKIGTHSGKFHCDEAFACFMLKQLDEFKDHTIVRSRDETVLNDCDVVVDVGAYHANHKLLLAGVFDHGRRRYDHHQKEFQETMGSLGILPFNTRLSSAGLVYAHYGKQLIAKELGVEVSDPMVSIFYQRLYATFVEAVDAVDNGIPAYDGLPRYHCGGGISGRVGHFNPHWNEKDVDPDERFVKAMNLVGSEFLESLHYLANVWWPARQIVVQALETRLEADPSGRIIVLPSNGGVPWKEHFFDLEESMGLLEPKITFIVFGDAADWRVQAIPNNRLSTFDNRQPLPASWRGLRDAALSEKSGVPECVFVHVTGFIGGNRSRDGAVAMAREALKCGSQDEEKKAEETEGAVKKMKLDTVA